MAVAIAEGAEVGVGDGEALSILRTYVSICLVQPRLEGKDIGILSESHLNRSLRELLVPGNTSVHEVRVGISTIGA